MAKKMKKFDKGGPSYENNIRDGGTSFIDEFEKSKAKAKTNEEKPRFETKEGKNPNISDETREKAMKFVEKSDEAKKEVKPESVATSRKMVAKAKTSLPMPDYSNEDLDRMGMNEDLKPAAPVAPIAPAKKKPFIDIPEKSNIGFRQFKTMASGGKVKSASARADGCAIRGKTRA